MNHALSSSRLLAASQESKAVANQLGLWAFLATEIMFFGGLFTSYAVYRHAYAAAFAAGSSHLEYWIGTVNTAVLLTSSLFMALADHAIKRGQRARFHWCLLATALLGMLFLGFKGIEYHQKFREQMIPGMHFHAEGMGASLPQLQMFFVLYFAMTGLHAVHMVAGLAAIGWLFWRSHRGHVSQADHASVEMTGLYWHFIDGVWVFLYPLLYLIPPR